MTPAGKQRLILDEGTRPDLYDDSTGKSIGRLASGGYATIGVGRNLSTNPLSQDEIDLLFTNDITVRWNSILKAFPWVANISPVRQDVLLMVEFNTGNVASFKLMLAALQAGNLIEAGNQLMNSKVAIGIGHARYTRMKDALIHNTW